MDHAPDTIAAVATARGQAALAIVRVSGAEACSVAAACFRGADLTVVPSHTVHVGFVGEEGHDLDQVVATVFRAPRSSTGEDVVEFTCHGGDVAAPLVLEALVGAGARHALPGEFTQRAFLNGKLDLAQAEAVADLIHASSRRAHEVSMAQLRGDYSRALADLRDELLEVTALVELELDFAEEDVEFASREGVTALLGRAEALLLELVESYRYGHLLREGVRVVIAGRPNAGKSTLLNRLVGYDRAIVSATPGTTRDEIEAEAEIEGVRYVFTDTAGLRDTADAIEAEGVRRAEARLAHADLVLYVFDASVGLDEEERRRIAVIQAARPELPLLTVANKTDLLDSTGMPAADVLTAATHPGGGIVELVTRITRITDAHTRPEGSVVVTNARHRAHLSNALNAVRRVQAALSGGMSGDLLAVDLRVALRELGAITGAITHEDVLDQIFSRFCIGK